MKSERTKLVTSCFLFFLLLCVTALTILAVTGVISVDFMSLNSIPLWSFSIVLYGTLLFGMKFAKPKTFFDDALSLPVAKGIQGFCAIGIVFHHLIQSLMDYNVSGVAYFYDIGVLFVAIFFFFSGYGIYLSYMTKPNYLNGFLKKRLPKLLLPYFLISWIYIVVRFLIGEPMDLYRLFTLFTTLRMPNTQSWYIVVTAILYLIFYLTFRYIKNKNVAYALNGVIAVILVVFSLLNGHCASGEEWFKGEWWFNTILLFFAGMTYAKFRHKLLPVIKKFYWILLPVCLAGFWFFYTLTLHSPSIPGYWTETMMDMHYGDKFITISVQLPMILFFVISFLLLTMKVQFGNRLLRFLGTYTIELYLVQNLFICYLGHSGLLQYNTIFVIACYVGTIALGYGIHKIDIFLIKRICK